MNPIPELTPALKQLRLSGILDSLATRNRQAIDSKLACTEFLALLIQDEVARREQRKFASCLTRGRRSPFDLATMHRELHGKGTTLLLLRQE